MIPIPHILGYEKVDPYFKKLIDEADLETLNKWREVPPYRPGYLWGGINQCYHIAIWLYRKSEMRQSNKKDYP